MSTGPTTTPDSQSTNDPMTTEIAARGRADPWTTGEDAGDPELWAALAQRQFDPYSVARLRNLVDEENAYCS